LQKIGKNFCTDLIVFKLAIKVY